MSSLPSTPILRAVPPAAIPEAPETPERKLLRALQVMIAAYRPDNIPTPRERSAIRDRAHEAIDAYLLGKLAESSGRRS